MSERPRFVVAGGSGLIGRRLAAAWAAAGADVVVLSRSTDASGLPAGVRVAGWDGRNVGAWASEVDGAAAVVNLAGENVGGGRWTAARKRRLRDSRLLPTRALVEAIGRAERRPAALLQASAVGFYGDRGGTTLDESAEAGSGFLPALCVAWEAASAAVEALGVRRVLLRTGIVLAREGGALPKMLPAFRCGVGGPLGDGRQWFPWIHLDDAVSAIRFVAADDELRGAVNLTAPAPVTNAELTRELARACRRFAVLRVPPFALRALFGEMAQVLLGGQRVVPAKLAAAGFRFAHPQLAGALAALLARPR
ncbi:MAG: TIGR01777 family oxidoreductase [Thermoanaerobaculia bacterium]|nr:TIGR01777 family oxidoreductase [Thermoanaerobaculia bacterium]